MWILILLLTSNYGLTITTAEFNTKDKCQMAGSVIDFNTSQIKSSFVCVEK